MIANFFIPFVVNIQVIYIYIYLLSFGTIYSLGILSVFDYSINIFGRLFLLQSEEAYRVYYYFRASCMSRMYFSTVVSINYFVHIGSKLIALL